VDEKRANEIFDKFLAEYEELSSFIVSLQLVPRFIAEGQKSRRDYSPELAQQIAKELTDKGEDPDELYLFIGLAEPLPDGTELPAKYEGLKVDSAVYEFVDIEIVPVDKSPENGNQ